VADEVGAAFVSLVPSFRNGPKIIGAELNKAFAGADKIAERAGVAAAKTFGSAFGKGKSASSGIEATQKRIAAAAKASAKEVEQAREAEADATRKLQIEENKLQELRASGKAKASQILSVEDRLVKSQRALRDAQGRTAAAMKANEQQQEAATRELAELSRASDGAGRSLLNLGKRLKGVSFSGLVKGAGNAGRSAASAIGTRLSGISRSAASAGLSAGSAFGSSFTSNATNSIRGFVSTAGAALAAVGLGTVASFGLEVAGQNEQAAISFTTMLGSAEKAQSFIQEMQAFAAKTPFELPGLQESASQLIAAGIDSRKVIPIMTTLGNVTSGMGTGAEGIDRATVALQQMNAAQRITAEDLNQLRDAGIPVYDLLAAATGKSKAEVTKLASAGKLGKAELDAMMKALESGKGLERFNGLMDKQSESLTGMASTLKDTFGQGLAVALAPALPIIKDVIGGATALVGPAMNQLAVGIKSVVDWGGRLAPVWQTATDSAKLFIGSFTGEGADVDVPFMNEIIDAGATARSIFDSVGPLISGVLDNWLGLFKSLAPAVGPFLGNLFAAVKSLAPVFQQLQKTVFAAIGDIVSQLLPTIGRLVQTLLPTLASIGSAVGQVLNAVIPIVSQIVTTLLAAIEQNMPTIQSAFQTLGSIISGVAGLITAVWERVGPIVLPIISALFGTIVGVIDGAFKIIDGLIKTVTGILTGDWEKAGEGLKQIVGGVFKIVVSIIDGAKNIIGTIVGAIVGFFTTVIGGAFNFFKRAAQTVFNFVVGAVRSFWNSKLKPVVDRLVNFFRVTIPAAFNLMRSKAAGALSAVISVIRGFWYDRIKPVVDRLVNFFKVTIPGAFGTLRTKITDILRKVRDFIRGAFDKNNGIPSIFTKAVDQIGKIWLGLQELAKKPIRFIVEDVINKGLIKSFNDLVGLIPFANEDWKLAPMTLPAGFDRGGILPGTSTWRQGDDQLVPMRRGEGVTITEALDPYETNRLLALNRHVLGGGTAAGFRKRIGEGKARGGVVWPATSRQLSPNYRGHSGVDIPRPAGDPIFAIDNGTIDYTGWGRGFGQAVFQRLSDGLKAVYGHTSRILVQAGQSVRAGQTIAEVGSTGRSTGNHLHVEVNGAGGFGSAANRQFTLNYLTGAPQSASGSEGSSESGLNPLGWVLDTARDKLKGAIDGVLKDVPNTGIGKLLRGIPHGLVDYLHQSVKSMAGQGTAGNFGAGSGNVSGSTSAITRAAAAEIGPKFGISSISTYPGHDPSETKALDFMTSDLSQHNAIAQFVWANARRLAINYMISWNRIWNLQRDGVGEWRRYTRYGGGGSLSQQHKDHVHLSFFASGTRNAPAGPAVVGEDGPELVWFNGGEQVTNARQTADLLKAKGITSRTCTPVDASGAGGDGASSRMVHGELDITASGKAYIRGLARDETRQEDRFDRTIDRMRGK